MDDFMKDRTDIISVRPAFAENSANKTQYGYIQYGGMDAEMKAAGFREKRSMIVAVPSQ